MKKRIVSLLLLGMYFFGGLGIGMSQTFAITPTVPLVVAPNADGSVQTNNANGTSTRLNTDGSTTTFDAAGNLTSHTAPDGIKTTWASDGSVKNG